MVFHFRFWLSATLVALLLNSGCIHGEQKRVVGYFTSWSTHDARNFHVPDIPGEKITHVIYAFANIEDGYIAIGDEYADVERYYEGDNWHEDSLRGSFRQLLILKENFPHIKTLISIGGAEWSREFSNVALTQQSRSGFALSCIEFIQEYGFDGIDIDWEYPVSGGNEDNYRRPEDRRNYTLLLEQLRMQLDILEHRTGREYLLTASVPVNPVLMANYEMHLVHNYVDWLNVMAYDYFGHWDQGELAITNFHTPLFADPDSPLPQNIRSTHTVEASINNYIQAGAPHEKINVCLAFYGRGYGNVLNQNNGLYASFEGSAPEGTYEDGIFAYWDIADNYIERNGYLDYWHPMSKVPWLFNPHDGIMISYDNERSIREKAQFVKFRNLGGVCFWDFSLDRNHGLIDVINEVIPVRVKVKKTALFPTATSVSIHPNPVNSTAAINISLPHSGAVKVAVFNDLGKKVTDIAGIFLPAGTYEYSWETGALPAGTYYCRLSGDHIEMVEQIVVIK